VERQFEWYALNAGWEIADRYLDAVEATCRLLGQHPLLGPRGSFRHTYVTPAEDRRTWRVQQMLVDPEGHNDWVAEFDVDLAASRAAREPILRLRRLGSLA
jgi:plasmid stabilization system protein ParE